MPSKIRSTAGRGTHRQTEVQRNTHLCYASHDPSSPHPLLAATLSPIFVHSLPLLRRRIIAGATEPVALGDHNCIVVRNPCTTIHFLCLCCGIPDVSCSRSIEGERSEACATRAFDVALALVPIPAVTDQNPAGNILKNTGVGERPRDVVPI